MSQYLFKNFQLLEPSLDEVRDGYELLVEGATIREVSEKPIKSELATVIDCGGRTLMPGLIDSHVHQRIVGKRQCDFIAGTQCNRTVVGAHAAEIADAVADESQRAAVRRRDPALIDDAAGASAGKADSGAGTVHGA